jgi:hypothetical protein
MVSCNLRCLHNRHTIAIIVITALQALGFAPADGAPPHGARLHNPFCAISTYVNRDIASQGLALLDAKGRGIIYIGADEALGNRAYRDFLMAHECCHHTLGHLRRLRVRPHGNALLGAPLDNSSIELEADCCAAAALAQAGRLDAIREAAARMRSFGAMPTGAEGYPPGNMRAMFIEDCAAGLR